MIEEIPHEDDLKSQMQAEHQEEIIYTTHFNCLADNNGENVQESLLVSDDLHAKLQLTREDAGEEILFTHHLINDNDKMILDHHHSDDDDKVMLIHHHNGDDDRRLLNNHITSPDENLTTFEQSTVR